MASTLSQAQMIKQFVFGMQLQERQLQAHLLGTQIQSGLWHSHQMATTSSQVHLIEKIHVWNVMTGRDIGTGEFFYWKTLQSWSVAFSPRCHGQYIVSGLKDQTIHLWNVMTGEATASPFTGHTGSVWSVAFSPDGQHIASGSDDRTIRVWNAITGDTVAGPFTGHTGFVMSVAFSPDGQYIVSGSRDRTIRVWNAMTGEIAASPFFGHMAPDADLWHSRQTASILSRVLSTGQFDCQVLQ